MADPESFEDRRVEDELESGAALPEAEGEMDEEAQQKEKERIIELKKSKSSFMKDLVRQDALEKRRKNQEEQMKVLINQAEKYASFLLSKHKMHTRG